MTAVYLCTRVCEPTEDNYLKLTKVVQSICATVHLLIVIGCDDSRTLL